MRLAITTFNVENLFNRYAALDEPWQDRRYETFVQAVGLVSIASRAGDLVQYATTDIQRNNTAHAILDAAPDILAVQEIENIYTLRIFNDTYLDNYFDRILSIDGNDPRGIDVGLMVRRGAAVQILGIRTHVDEAVHTNEAVRHGTARNFGYLATKAIFSRDCLEVDVTVGTKVLTFLVNHFKAQDGTAASTKRRTQQAERVAQFVQSAVDNHRLPMVLGDLNVDPETDESLASLLQNAHLQDPFPPDTWTHYYIPQKKTSRLDYNILPHKSLNVLSTDIGRKGLTTKAQIYTGPRYATVGQEHTEASDHCPTSVVLDL
ncbi:MAG TPA: endonuclease/exonuclease/phosphatase family protein [Nitrososphaera sp.]|nr:endonuclease/exonuclease/phosphatase family protein [Nitrososphaera sp.]